MFGRAYDFHRHSGRMIMDNNQRMSNRAEAGLGLAGMIGFVLVIAVILALIGVI